MPAERRESLAASPRRSLPMPPKSSPPDQPELFRSALVNLVDPKHPLVRLAGLIDWDRFRTAFGPLYRDGVGRPGLPNPPHGRAVASAEVVDIPVSAGV
jgi:hypothetical protein